MIPMVIGRDRAEVARRIAAARAIFPTLPVDEEGWRAASFLAGSASEIGDALDGWAEAGMERVLLQMMDQEDIAALESFARGVLPSL
jgi:hypothetical protein